MAFQHTDQLSLHTPDANGELPSISLLGKRYRHSGNQKLYHLLGYAWNGETDTWMTVMQEVSATMGNLVFIVRPLSHLEGKRANGEKRYVVEASA